MKSRLTQIGKTKLLKLSVLILIVFLAGTFVGYATTPTTTFTISTGIYPGAPSYTVWTDGANYYAKDAYGLQPSWSGSTNASAVINAAIGNLTVGRTWIEKIVIKGDFTSATGLTIPSFTEVDWNGKFTYMGTGVAITIGDGSNETDFSILRGVRLYGNNQALGGILLNDFTCYCSIYDVLTKEFSKTGAYGFSIKGTSHNSIDNHIYNLRTTNNDVGCFLNGGICNTNKFYSGEFGANRIGIYTLNTTFPNTFYSPDIEGNSEYGIDDNGDFLEVDHAYFELNTLADIRAGNEVASRWATISTNGYLLPTYTFGSYTCRSPKITNYADDNIFNVKRVQVANGTSSYHLVFPTNCIIGEYIVIPWMDWSTEIYFGYYATTDVYLYFNTVPAKAVGYGLLSLKVEILN